MGTTRLQIYNGALRILGERRLASLTENREPRRVLDDVWDDNAVPHCLEEGDWKFARRTAKMQADPGITTQFGANQAFALPADYVRLSGVWQDEYFNVPLTQYAIEAGIFYSNLPTVYFSYVSNDPAYGMNLAAWPDSFNDFVEAHFAAEAALRITGDKDKLALANAAKKEARKDALNRGALEGPTVFPPQGTWVSSRLGGPRRDRGNRNSFYG